jgi:mono/diheme cytochrome c family protein
MFSRPHPPARRRPKRLTAASPYGRAALCTRPLFSTAAVLALTLLAGGSACADDLELGRHLYEQQCASCHGPDGAGVKDAYEQPLVGDQSVGQLTRYISESMPEGEPETVVGDDARAVAAYIHDAFYSELARERMRPATIELARLTNRQYEQVLADLVGHFESFGWPSDKRGLSAEYFNDDGFNRKKRVIERVDATIDFDYGESTPDAEQIEKEEFAMKWRGGVIAPETGEYEFILETQNAGRLYVNSYDTPIIDAWVKSGDQTEYSATIRLLGGRLYPLQVEFRSVKEPTASIRLKWKPPHQAEQIIPERALTPDWTGRVYVVTNAFPPDDRSTGYERGTSISKAWYEATTQAALDVAAYVADNLDRLAGTKEDDEQRSEKLRRFARTFTERAFRRPLSDAEQQMYIDRQFEDAVSEEAAIKRVVILSLTSPRFLYREAGQSGFDDFAVASWLAFALWDSLPDEALWQAAAKGELGSEEQVRSHARRMVENPRTKAKVREFFHQWLGVDRFHELAKSPEAFPEFDEPLISDLRTSLDLFLEEVVWSDTSDFRRLLLDESLYLNSDLATFYGAQAAGERFEKVSFEEQGRAGVLSHPYLMAGLAYDETTSPIHRGVFLARSLLGRTLKPPPIAVAPTSPDLAPDLTTRERVLAQTEPAACQICHQLINPLGFTMEQFDAVGRFRDQEQGRPIDATGSYLTGEGDEVSFAGVRELAQFLAGSSESHEAFVEQLFQVMIKQPIRAFGPDMHDQLRTSFEAGDYNIRKLLVEIATRSALTARELRSES